MSLRDGFYTQARYSCADTDQMHCLSVCQRLYFNMTQAACKLTKLGFKASSTDLFLAHLCCMGWLFIAVPTTIMLTTASAVTSVEKLQSDKVTTDKQP